MKFICICGKEFKSQKSLSAHQASCKEHYLYRDGNLDNYIERTKNLSKSIKNAREKINTTRRIHGVEKHDLRIKQWISEQHRCEKCGKIMTEYFGSGRFCSRACANGRIHSEETKKKISASVKNIAIHQKTRINYKDTDLYVDRKNKKIIYLLNIIRYYYIDGPTKCKFCNKPLKYKDKDKLYCSIYCKSKANRTVYQLYVSQCKFNLFNYPKEFNLDLIDEFGIYAASNHGNNLTGISRDHKFSKFNGYYYLIDPYIISHPANCELMKHTRNNDKKRKNSISLKELILSIEKWNQKYGEYENSIDYSGIEKFKNYEKIKEKCSKCSYDCIILLK